MLEKTLKEIYTLNPSIPLYKNKNYFDRKIGNSTYGEMSQSGVDEIIKRFPTYFNEDTIFYDLGSGLGKVVLHMGLVVLPYKSIGVEYSTPRFNGSLHLKDKYALENKNIEFHNVPLQEQDVSNATVVYSDNTVFPIEVCKYIYDHLPKNCLYLFKRLGYKEKEIKETIHKEDGIKSTYLHNHIYWLIKE